MPDRLVGMNSLIDAVAASSSSYTPTPTPVSAPPSLRQAQSQAKDVSVQSLRVAVRQQEAQIQHDLMNISEQPPPTQDQNQRQNEYNSTQPSLPLFFIYSKSKPYLAPDNISTDLETDEMIDLMHQLDAKHYVGLYFSHFHGQWPFLARSQFHPEREPPILVLAMVMCGLRMTEEKTLMRLAWALHAHLQAIFVTQMVRSPPFSPLLKSSGWC